MIVYDAHEKHVPFVDSDSEKNLKNQNLYYVPYAVVFGDIFHKGVCYAFSFTDGVQGVLH